MSESYQHWFYGIVELIDLTRYRHYDLGCHDGYKGRPISRVPPHEMGSYEDKIVESRALNVDGKKRTFRVELLYACKCLDKVRWPSVLSTIT